MIKIDTVLCISLMCMALLAMISANESLAESREIEIKVNQYMLEAMSNKTGGK
jgi:hypothetical protein